MHDNKVETIQTENLGDVTGGGWLDMLSGGKLKIGSLLGGASESGGIFGVNKDGKGKSLSEGISGLFSFGGDSSFKAVEGRDHQGFGG